MATAATNVDALGFYLTGASSDGATQDTPDSALGGYRSGIESEPWAFQITTPIAPIRIDQAFGANAGGLGTITATSATEIKWTPASGTIGAAVSIANGETKLIESNTASQAIRVTRINTSAVTSLKGAMGVRLLKAFNNTLGMDNITSAEAIAGLNTYRALMIRNRSALSCTSIALWIKTLGTQRVSGSAQLGGSGSGTITTATANGFADWPTCGWVRITNAGTLREIAYYTSRTSTSLTIPSAGRARLGTSASAGAATDTIDAVPGIRIGVETAAANGSIQTIANDSTAPSGVTWFTGITSATGATIATLTTLTNAGLWVHRETPAGAFAHAEIENAISYQFTYSAVVYTGNLYGMYRTANDALDKYEIYAGIDADATFSATVATSATLPMTYTLSPSAGDQEFRLVVRKRNAYNLVSQNIYQRLVKINSGGGVVVKNPTAPTNVTLTDFGGGLVTLNASYSGQNDDPKADMWAIYQTGDGTNPTGAETPTYVAMTDESFFFNGSTMRLAEKLGPYAQNQDLRILLRTRNNAANKESTNTTPVTITVGTSGVGPALQRRAFIGSSWGQRQAADSLTRIVYIDQANNIYWNFENGYTELWADTTLVWRLKYDSGGASNNGLWTTFGYQQETITGTPATEPIEVASWGGGSNVMYVTSNGVRRMKIDVTNTALSFTSIDQTLAVGVSYDDDALVDAVFRTLFQVYDPYIGGYNTAVDLDADGTLRMNVGWRQVGTAGEIE